MGQILVFKRLKATDQVLKQTFLLVAYVKVKSKESSLDLTIHWADEVEFICFLTSAYEGKVWSALCPAAFTYPNVS